MKQLIVLCGMILLGVCLYRMILGPGEDSLLRHLMQFWADSLASRTRTP